nr:hypothetical protein [uncultured bacterium]
MFGEKKINPYETQDSMGFTINWYSPMAYFLMFFSFIWCAFLVFWYSLVIAGGAPWIFVLFPLIHVAAGIGMVYYTLCLFLNKTYIDLDANYLSVEHKPIPWWRGNKALASKDIEQLYVKEKISQSKNGTNYTYQLRAKMVDQSDQEILSLPGIESHQAQEIEQQMERFLRINDRPVKGEYARTPSTEPLVHPRRQRRLLTDSPLELMYASEENEFSTIKDEALEIISVTQYDWHDGNSDKLFQLINEQRAERLVYLEQNKALLNAFSEKAIHISETGSIHFSMENPPKSIVVGGETYALSRLKKGDAFIGGVPDKIAVEQCVYVSTNQQRQIRIINNQDQLSCYKGEKLLMSDFGDTLDLNRPPIREKRRLDEEKNWDEGDFV